ncbi:MAG: hypothetical protein M0023_02330 [Desulfobacteraceae bacterium]|nr:hypothetical protein [Desulfobacteraceae bacterium]
MVYWHVEKNATCIYSQFKRMSPRDLAALSPLITQQINPYGRFELDMEARLPLAA